MLMLCNTHTLKPVLTAQAESLPLKTPVSGLPWLSTCLPMASPWNNSIRSGFHSCLSAPFGELSKKLPNLHLAGLPDPAIYELALKQGRIILTINIKDFRPLLRDDSPGVISIPENWSAQRIDTKLTALLMKHSPNYFRGRYRPLAAEDSQSHAA